MIRQIANYFQTLPTVFIDGSIYVILSIFAFNQIVLSSDEAAKYIVPIILFYAKWINGILNAGFLALKMYRSTAFADHQADKKRSSDTQQFIKQMSGPEPVNTK